MGIGNSNGLFRQTVKYQSRRLGAIHSLYRLKCGGSSCEWGLPGPFFPDWATMAHFCGVCRWALGKEGELAQALNRHLA